MDQGSGGTPQRRLATEKESLLLNREVAVQIAANADGYVDNAVAEATVDVLSSGGDLTTIGEAIGSAFSTGLIHGLAIAFVADGR